MIVALYTYKNINICADPELLKNQSTYDFFRNIGFSVTTGGRLVHINPGMYRSSKNLGSSLGSQLGIFTSQSRCLEHPGVKNMNIL
jgi:hypothetical protein